MVAEQVVYRIKPGAHLPQKAAQSIGEELERISEKNGGQLSAARVVAEARKKSSALHGFFEWDDPTAARLYREHQARHIMNCVTVVVKSEEQEEEQEVRAFHVVPVQQGEAEEEGRAYVSIARVASDPAMTQSVIDRAREDLAVWKRRYEGYRTAIPAFAKEFEPVFRLAS